MIDYGEDIHVRCVICQIGGEPETQPPSITSIKNQSVSRDGEQLLAEGLVIDQESTVQPGVSRGAPKVVLHVLCEAG
jgi:hypothetical protein